MAYWGGGGIHHSSGLLSGALGMCWNPQCSAHSREHEDRLEPQGRSSGICIRLYASCWQQLPLTASSYLLQVPMAGKSKAAPLDLDLTPRHSLMLKLLQFLSC
jgi:hypothetical protein